MFRRDRPATATALCRSGVGEHHFIFPWSYPASVADYFQNLLVLVLGDYSQFGYEILSITGDGFSGLRAAFFGIPFQMCHVHMERIAVKGTTRKPILEAGQALLALIKTLHYSEENTFKNYFKKYVSKYQSFLNEKTINLETGRSEYTHEPLHQATLSLMKFLPYLFTFKKDKNIPRTTNTLEGHFSHIRDIVAIHRGLRKPHMEKVLNSIFLASTIAPTQKKLNDIL